MKKTFFSLLVFLLTVSVAFGQFPNSPMHGGGGGANMPQISVSDLLSSYFGKRGIRYDFRDEFSDTLAAGSVNNTLSTSGHVRTVVDTYASTELITNSGFETVTAAGPPADFGTWIESVGDGNIEVETTIKHGGSNAVKLTSGATPDSTPLIQFPLSVIPNKNYILTFWVKGDGVNNGRFTVYDITNSVNIVYRASTGNSSNYTQIVYPFTTLPGCTSIFVRLQSPNTVGGVSYFDDVSILPTSGLLSIGSGALNFAGGKASPAYGDPGIWYPSTTRVAGKMLISDLTVTDVTSGLEIGYDTNQSGALAGSSIRIVSDTYLPYDGGTARGSVATPADATNYKTAVIQRAAGAYHLLKTTTGYWKLVWSDPTNNTATLYPALSNYNAAYNSSFVRQPSQRWLPTPLLSHGFSAITPSDGAGHAETSGLGSGGGGVVMTDNLGTWGVSGGKGVATELDGTGIAINTANLSTVNQVISATITRSAGTVGIVTRYTDASNHLSCYHDGTNAKCDDVVAGSPTNRISAAAAIGAGAMVVITDGTAILLYLNNALIGTGTTSITTGTRTGMKTTDLGNTFDSLISYARGTEGQYEYPLNLFIQPYTGAVGMTGGPYMLANTGGYVLTNSGPALQLNN
jgi:hypothetical protein